MGERIVKKITEILNFRDCIYTGQALFFYANDIGRIVKYDLQKNTNTILSYDSQNVDLDLAIYYDGVIYLVEVSGKNLVVYHLKDDTWKWVPIGCDNDQDGNFAYLDHASHKILIFTREQQTLVLYDVIRERIERVRYPADASKRYITGCRFRDRYLIFPENGQNVLEYDVMNRQWKVHHLSEALKNCVHVMVSEDEIYILQTNGRILRWNYESGEMEVIISAENVYEEKKAAVRLCLTKEDIIVLPSLAKDIIRIHRGNYEATIYRDYPKDFSYDVERKYWSKYYGYCESDAEYYFSCRTSEYILKVEKQSGNISWIKSEISRWEIIKAYMEKRGYYYEGESDLRCLLEMVGAGADKKNTRDMTVNYGKEIYRRIRR